MHPASFTSDNPPKFVITKYIDQHAPSFGILLGWHVPKKFWMPFIEIYIYGNCIYN